MATNLCCLRVSLTFHTRERYAKSYHRREQSATPVAIAYEVLSNEKKLFEEDIVRQVMVEGTPVLAKEELCIDGE